MVSLLKKKEELCIVVCEEALVCVSHVLKLFITLRDNEDIYTRLEPVVSSLLSCPSKTPGYFRMKPADDDDAMIPETGNISGQVETDTKIINTQVKGRNAM